MSDPRGQEAAHDIKQAQKMAPEKRAGSPGDRQGKKRKTFQKAAKHGEVDEVLRFDIRALLEKSRAGSLEQIEHSRGNDGEKAPKTVVREYKSVEFPETEVTVSELSSTGDGLALSPAGDHVYAVPFSAPGDRVRIKVVRTMGDQSYSHTDLLQVLSPGHVRDDSQIKCQYFGRCSGCQLQMLPYEDQLHHKKTIIEKAYRNFSNIPTDQVPVIEDTVGSPLQYGYRTKLTPHFQTPSTANPKGSGSDEDSPPQVPPIGFNHKGRKLVLDIEDCPLGTDIVRKGFISERKRVAENIKKYKRGATLLMRESTTRVSKTTADPANGTATDASTATPDVIRHEHQDYIEEKRCVTDQNAVTYEYVDNYVFQNRAGEFFQNNNSILGPFTEYIRNKAIPKDGSSTGTTPRRIKFLLDAYSGSGLFTMTLSPLFISSLGVDISSEGIEAARENARMNNLPNTGFAASDAKDLFHDVPYPADRTLLVIDPPRKGCGDDFLRQMMRYGPARVVYVSCNVHTQARDVGVLAAGAADGTRYEIESIQGFDFFPQTGHVESIAVLNKA